MKRITFFLFILIAIGPCGLVAQSALDFDGVNDNATASAVMTQTDNLTLEAWIKPSESNSYNWIVCLDVSSLAIGTVNGYLTYLVNNSTASSTSTQLVPLNEWNHVALVRRNGTYELYYNGANITPDVRTTAPSISTGNLNISRASGEIWQGGIDEVRIWSVARTAAEIAASYAGELSNPTSQTGLKAYYKMNEGVPAGTNTSVTQLADASGNGKHATLNNFALTGSTSNFISDVFGSYTPVLEVYSFTGEVQTFTVPSSGTYKLEVWGAQGGNDVDYPSTNFGGRGGYATGEVYLSAGTTLYIYVGSQGSGCNTSSWYSSGGGGATDIRLVGGTWNNSSGLLSRILVAGGGGGRHGKNYESPGGAYVGNDGGGSSSPSFTTNGYTITGSTDQNGGSSTYISNVVAGSFGYGNSTGQTNTCSVGGYNGGAAGSDGWANGGAGGGWYGGCASWPTSAGGSAYVLTSGSYKPSGYSPGSSYYMTNTSLISGNAQMPNPAGGLMTGRSGNGYARITRLGCANPTDGGTIAAAQTICSGTSPLEITQNQAPSGTVNGTIEYQWQVSTTSATTGFADISGATSSSYQPGLLTQTTWYKRRVKVDCESNWLESNVIEITVNPLLRYRSKQSGNWATAANWEQYNGYAWVAATSYPGEVSNDCSNPMVTLQTGHQMEIQSGSNITIPKLKCEGTGKAIVRAGAKLTVNTQLEMDQNTGGGIVKE